VNDAARYAVLIGDISGSRRLAQKTQFSETLWTVVQRETRDRFGSALATRFEITAWDEWEGVLRTPDRAWNVIRFWERRLTPVRLTVGIGVGPLDTPLECDPRKTTGEAFYRAREALEEAKASKSITYVVDSSHPRDINLTFLLRSALVRKLTRRQREVIDLYEELGDVVTVAAKLGVTHQNVSQILRAAEYDAIAAAEEYVQQRLGEVG